MSNNKVLFVDDEIKVLNSIKRSTLEENYESFIATSGDKALELLAENEFSVMVTDMRMPGMDGLSLLKKVKELYPNVVRMVLSGYNQLPQILTTINQVGVSKFILKPWLVEEEFLPAVREGVEYYNLKREGEELKNALVNRNTAYQNILKSNNEVMSNIQKDLHNISHLYSSIENINKVLLTKIKSGVDCSYEFGKFIELSSNIFKTFLSLQSSKNEKFLLNKLVKNIKENFNKAIDLEECKEDIAYKGNYKVILFVITELCKQLVKEHEDSKLLVDLVGVATEKIIFTINKEKNVSLNFESKDISLLVFLLNDISSLFNGSVSIGKNDIKVEFKLI